MNASQIMTRKPVSLLPEASLVEAVRLMLQHKISGLPVVTREGHVVGIITEADLLRRSETDTEKWRPRWLEFLLGKGRIASEYAHTHGRRVHEVMQSIVYTVGANASLEDVVRLMERHSIKRVPVVRDNVLVGIISRADVVRALAQNLRTLPTQAEDRSIRDSLIEELKNQYWAPLSLIEISVKNGVVELSGCVTDDRQRQGLRVAAENTPGAKGVKEDLILIQPLTTVSGEAPLDPYDPQGGRPKCVAF